MVVSKAKLKAVVNPDWQVARDLQLPMPGVLWQFAGMGKRVR